MRNDQKCSVMVDISLCYSKLFCSNFFSSLQDKWLCLKKWRQKSLDITSEEQRVLIIGATLPPWGHEYMIEIHISSYVPLRLVKDFVVEL